MELSSDIPSFERRPDEQDIGVTDLYQDLKFRTFELTLEYLDMKNLDAEDIARGVLQDEVAQALSVALMGEGVALNSTDRSRLIREVE